MRLGLAALVAAGIAGAIRSAAADELYQWKDEKGRIHFSNIGPSEKSAEHEQEPAGETAEAAPPEAPPETAADAGAEAEGAPAEGAPAEAPLAAPKPRETPSAHASLSDDSFSSTVSRERARLRRELARERQHVQDIEARISQVRNTQNQAIVSGLPDLPADQRPRGVVSPQEAELQTEKEAAAKRVEDIRKQYDDLHDEAVKRYGSQPPWWLSLD